MVLFAICSALMTIGALYYGMLYYNSARQGILQNKMHELSTVADLRVAQIERWREEYIKDATVLLADPITAVRMRQLAEGRRDGSNEQAILTYIKAIEQAYQFRSVSICDKDGKVILSSGDGGERVGAHAMAIFAKSKISGAPEISDVHMAPTHAMYPHLDLVIPILSPGRHQASGFILLRIDPEKYLYKMVHAWPTPSQTSETLIVRKEGDYILYLNDLRHPQNTVARS